MHQNPFERIVTIMAKGNPGCATMLVEIAKTRPPEDFYCVVDTFLTHGITGSRAYMLWNDACNRNTADLVELASKISSGRLPMNTVNAHLAEVRCRPFTADEETGPVPKNDSADAFRE